MARNAEIEERWREVESAFSELDLDPLGVGGDPAERARPLQHGPQARDDALHRQTVGTRPDREVGGALGAQGHGHSDHSARDRRALLQHTGQRNQRPRTQSGDQGFKGAGISDSLDSDG